MPATAGTVGAYGLIGMGAVFAGAARAPITAVVILFELTGEYSIILPLMTAIVLATGVSQLLSSDTVYTAKLRRRGVDLDRPVDPLENISLAMVMRPTNVAGIGALSRTISLHSTFADALHALLAADGDLIVVEFE